MKRAPLHPPATQAPLSWKKWALEAWFHSWKVASAGFVIGKAFLLDVEFIECWRNSQARNDQEVPFALSGKCCL